MRTIKNVRNLKWADPTGYRIEMEVEFEELSEGFLPFSALKRNPYCSDYEYSYDIFDRAAAGEFGAISSYTPPDGLSGAEAMEMLRGQRDALLQEEVDPVVSNPLRWGAMSEGKQAEWAAYRQALLDLPSASAGVEYTTVQTIDPSDPTRYTTRMECNISFPEKPE